MQDNYWKGRIQPKNVGSGERAELSQLRRKVSTLDKECTKLESQRSILQKQTDEMREQVKTSRLELKSKTRELTLALGSIERLSTERHHSEATLSSHKEKIRRLEARLATIDASSSQHQLIERLQQAVEEAEHQLQHAQQTARQLSQENTYLRQGIQLAAQELTRRSGSNIPGDLIETLARTQEELRSLTAKQQTTNQITVEAHELLMSAKDTIQTQYNALLTSESENEELRSRVEVAELEVETQKCLADELRQLIDALRPRAGALKQQRDALRRAVEVEKEMRQESETEGTVMREKVKVLHAELGALRGELRRVMALEGTTCGTEGGGCQDFNLSPLFPSAATKIITAAMYQKDTDTTIGIIHQGKENTIGVTAAPAAAAANHPPPLVATKKVQVEPLNIDFEFTRVEQEIHQLTGGDDCETPSLIIARLQQHQRQLLGTQTKKKKIEEVVVVNEERGRGEGAGDDRDQQQGDSPGPHVWHTNPLAASSMPSSPLSKPVIVPRQKCLSIREEEEEEGGGGGELQRQQQEGMMIKAVWTALPTTSSSERNDSAESSEWLRNSVVEADIEGLKLPRLAGKMEKKERYSGRNDPRSGVKLSLFDLANLQLP